MHADELWHSSRPSAVLARVALLPASELYALGWEAYLAVYRFGLKKPKEPHRPVVCVGNLQVGGTGKSPVTRVVAAHLRQLGREAVVSCSGYGAPHAEGAALAPSGSLRAAEWGDEPAMLRWLDPDLPLIVGRNRVRAAEIAHEDFPGAVLLMDDGFQHLPLKKHLTMVIDPEKPDNALCLPAGPYREPRRNRSRADLLLPGEFTVVAEPMRLSTPEGLAQAPSAYQVLCALGSPQRFIDSVRWAFPNSRKEPPIVLPDHDPLDAGTLLADLPTDVPIVVTAKDWVKLRDRGDASLYQFLIASHEVRIEPAHEFRSWLNRKLNEGG